MGKQKQGQIKSVRDKNTIRRQRVPDELLHPALSDLIDMLVDVAVRDACRDEQIQQGDTKAE